MSDVTDLMVLADVQKAIGYVLVVLLVGAFAVAILINMRKGRAEVGSEIELAPNRQPGMPDDELETKKLDRTLGAGLVVLAIIAVALPLYWLGEPGRQADAVEGFERTFVNRGEDLYVNGAQCASCHGPDGVGGVASYTITDPSTGDFVAQVEWQAPALDTLMYRYTPEQVKFILNYGRGYSPMPAWGAPGGGPLTEQQIDDLIFYLTSIQLPAEESATAVQAELDKTCLADDEGNCTLEDAEFETLGEAIFNMGYTTKFAGGAYSCGRCHTKGWSYGEAEVAGGGAMGPNMTGGSEVRQFPTAAQQEAFVSAYPNRGVAYGTNGQSSGRMGSFGVNPNTIAPTVTPLIPALDVAQVMLTPEQIAAVVAYERSL
jgi:mono/diheme cytochrome c family protein